MRKPIYVMCAGASLLISVWNYSVYAQSASPLNLLACGFTAGIAIASLIIAILEE